MPPKPRNRSWGSGRVPTAPVPLASASSSVAAPPPSASSWPNLQNVCRNQRKNKPGLESLERQGTVPLGPGHRPPCPDALGRPWGAPGGTRQVQRWIPPEKEDWLPWSRSGAAPPPPPGLQDWGRACFSGVIRLLEGGEGQVPFRRPFHCTPGENRWKAVLTKGRLVAPAAAPLQCWPEKIHVLLCGLASVLRLHGCPVLHFIERLFFLVMGEKQQLCRVQGSHLPTAPWPRKGRLCPLWLLAWHSHVTLAAIEMRALIFPRWKRILPKAQSFTVLRFSSSLPQPQGSSYRFKRSDFRRLPFCQQCADEPRWAG